MNDGIIYMCFLLKILAFNLFKHYFCTGSGILGWLTNWKGII